MIIIIIIIIIITKPVVVRALGLIKKGLDTSRIPGNIGTNEIQKITMLGTAHILRKVLSLK